MSRPVSWNPNENLAVRYKQLDSLRQYFPTLREVTKDTVYDVPMQAPGSIYSSSPLALRIILPPEFPTQAPALQLYPSAGVAHRMINPATNLFYPQIHEKLQQWSMHVSLGKMVFEIIQRLNSDPPLMGSASSGSVFGSSSALPNSQSSSSFSGLPATPSTLSGTMGVTTSHIPFGATIAAKPNEPPPSYSAATGISHAAPAPVHHTPMPAIPASFPELESRTTTEISELITNEETFRIFFEQLEGVKTMKSVREELQTSNDEVIRRNQKREEELAALKRRLNESKDILAAKKAEHSSAQMRQQELQHKFTPAAMIQQLAAAAADVDQESNETISSFTDGQIDHKEFVKRYMEQRKRYHLRAAKKESLSMNLVH